MVRTRMTGWGPAVAVVAALASVGCGGGEAAEFIVLDGAPSAEAGAGGETSGDLGPAPSDAGGPDAHAPDGSPEPISTAQDILTTDLTLDLTTLVGQATLVVQPGRGAGTVTLEVGELTVSRVRVDGRGAEPRIRDGVAVIPLAGAEGLTTIDVDYTFPERSLAQFDGWMPEQGVSFVWPYFCGNLFPCNSATADGVDFTMRVTGVEPPLTAIYPRSTYGDAPAYMPGIAVGEYERLDLGATSRGTALSVWHFPGDAAAAVAGTAHLREVFDFFERTYGQYAFGSEAGAVEVDWGEDSWGGMEHHPFFHVGRFDLGEEEVHAHEAGHAWFGNGVRMACWEDFVLSEGTTTYIAARALESVGGPNVWPMYVDDFLVPLCSGEDVNAIALPDTCNEIDLLSEDLWSMVPYMKGACFFEDVADLIGPEVVDEALADFYWENVHGAARMWQLIDTLKARSAAAERPAGGPTIDTLATEWLLTFDCPPDYAERCRAHQRGR